MPTPTCLPLPAVYPMRMDIETVIGEVQRKRGRPPKATAAARKASVYALTDDELHEALRLRRSAAGAAAPPPPGASGEWDPKGTQTDVDPTPTPPPAATSVSGQFDSTDQIDDDPDPWT